MRKKSTKLLALLTAGITAASLLAGCGSGGSDSAGTTDQAQETDQAQTEDTASTDDASADNAEDTAAEDTSADASAEASTYPLAEGGTLTYWLSLTPTCPLTLLI